MYRNASDEKKIQELERLQSAYFNILQDLTTRGEELERVHARLERDVELAGRVQERLMPREPLRMAGVHLVGRCQPSERIGGDYYDFFSPAPGVVNLAIADIAGHGISAALFMAMVRSAIRTKGQHGSPPEEVARYLNLLLWEELPDREVYVTGIYGRYECASRHLVYVNGGHFSPWRISGRGEATPLPGHGMAFGFVEEASYEKSGVVLAPHDTVLFFTDGLFQSASPARAMPGEDEIRKWVREIHRLTPEKGVEYLFEEAGKLRQGALQEDDQTVLLLRVE